MLCCESSRAHRSRRGAVAAELAVLLPPLVLIIAVGIDFARAFFAYITITDCAREGAIYGSIDSSHSTDTTGIQNAALAGAGSISPQPTVSSITGNDANDNNNPYVAVTVSYTFSSILVFPGFPSSMTLSRTVRMRVAPFTPS